MGLFELARRAPARQIEYMDDKRAFARKCRHGEREINFNSPVVYIPSP